MAKVKTDNLQLKRASMALDELVWLLRKVDVEQLREVADLFRDNLSSNSQKDRIRRTYQSGNENKDFLIGVLPRLFQDKDLFPQNDDISEFANAALGLDMSRVGKRSRYEIIGKIVVEMSNLSDSQFERAANALESLVDNSEELEKMVKIKKAGHFSWNETIQKLIEG
ncbi:hypothetical protein ACTU44_16310 [Thalassospira sp. SM2505]